MSTASKVLAIAKKEIGYSRWTDPKAGTKYGRWYAEKTGSPYFGTNGVPYCAMFVSWVFDRAGQKLAGLPTAGCGQILRSAKSAGLTVSKKSAKPGDVVIFDWGTSTEGHDHVGIVEKNLGSYIQTIEGNTSKGSSGSQGNGGVVARRTRAWGVVQAVIRPKYDGASATTKPSGTASTVDLGGDTVWGPRFTKELQKQLGTTVDGVISGQPKANKPYFWATEGTVKYGSSGSKAIEKLQRKVKAAGFSVGKDGADGLYGPASIKAHQRWLKAKGYGSIAADGYHGTDTCKAMAKALRAGAYR